MKFFSIAFLTGVLIAGLCGEVAAGGCSPLTKKQFKSIKECQNNAKRQAWMKEREAYWRGVAAKQASLQKQQARRR